MLLLIPKVLKSESNSQLKRMFFITYTVVADTKGTESEQFTTPIVPPCGHVVADTKGTEI